MPKKKSVLILYTGGTIGMCRTRKGYDIKPGYLEDIVSKVPQLQHPDLPKYIFKEYTPLLDSSNMQPSHWIQIAKDIYDNYSKYDGFIVLHGTDTLAYTASALSFMLRNLTKPVICTGAQIPIGDLRTDGARHIIDSLLIIKQFSLPEVCVYFHNMLLRGNRAQKVDSQSMKAFDSPNYPPLAEVGTHIRLNDDLLRKMPRGDLKMRAFRNPVIASTRLFPGISASVLEGILSQNVKGLILGTYGAGNAPSDNKDLLHVIREASDAGVVIVNVTQCRKGSVYMESYATGNVLSDCGVISGYDMTHEAALAKLYYLFSANHTPARVRHFMLQNLRGELTISD